MLLKDLKGITLKGRLTGEIVKNNIKHLKQVTFEITERCNFACAYGKYYDFASGRTHNDMLLGYMKICLYGIYEK
jgi:hypothetical protein